MHIRISVTIERRNVILMGLGELILIAVGLSMDAFAVAICKGLSIRKLRWKNTALVGLYFGLFQALMPTVGYLLGSVFADAVAHIDHWIAFFLLGAIGINMIRESLHDTEENCNPSLCFRDMVLLALATSIDALAIGVSFAFLQVDILPAVSIIGTITFLLSMLGMQLGHMFGSRFQSKAELLGGCVLIFLGAKILLEHLGLLPF